MRRRSLMMLALTAAFATSCSLLPECVSRRQLRVTCAVGVREGRTASGIAYDVTGCGSTMVLLHGFSADRRMWDRYWQPWATRHRLIRIDLPSHGGSTTPAAPYDLAREILAVLDAEAVGAALLVGHSAGAAAAIDVALIAPDRVSALVLLSPSVSGFRPTRPPDDMTRVIAAAREGRPRDAAAAWLDSPIMRIKGPLRTRTAFANMIEENWRVWVPGPGVATTSKSPSVSRLHELAVPTLVLSGPRDQTATPEVVETIVAAVPGAQSMSMGCGGHWFPVECPSETRIRVDEFVRHLHSR